MDSFKINIPSRNLKLATCSCCWKKVVPAKMISTYSNIEKKITAIGIKINVIKINVMMRLKSFIPAGIYVVAFFKEQLFKQSLLVSFPTSCLIFFVVFLILLNFIWWKLAFKILDVFTTLVMWYEFLSSHLDF